MTENTKKRNGDTIAMSGRLGGVNGQRARHWTQGLWVQMRRRAMDF
jgi:hypothetical protein